VSRALREKHVEVLVHTGQHYDYGMSQVFFDELGMPEPMSTWASVPVATAGRPARC